MHFTFTTMVPRLVVKPGLVWLFLFVPALCYYMSTRLRSLGLFRSSTYGQVVPTSVVLVAGPMSSLSSSSYSSCPACREAIRGKHSLGLYLRPESSPPSSSPVGGAGAIIDDQFVATLRYPLRQVQEDFESIVATTWKEDEELGRGYLLLSTNGAGRGKIFRWETGGGPIAIGRTLHLKDAGCRSGLYRACNNHDDDDKTKTGSGGIAVDTSQEPSRLIVAEYGEGRIVRLEENGARTPLVIGLEEGGGATTNRLSEPFQLLFTPYGDLMILDRRNSSSASGDKIWILPRVADIPPLPSLAVSREAHAWTQVLNGKGLKVKDGSTKRIPLPKTFFEPKDGGRLGGMVLSLSGERLLVTTQQGSSVLVVSLPLLDDLDQADEEDDDDDKDGKEDDPSRKILSRQSTILLDYSEHATIAGAGAIETDEKGNLYLAIDDGVLVLSEDRLVLAKISIDSSVNSKAQIVDLTIGSDKFLYVSTESTLSRLRVDSGPLEIKKELLIKA